MATLCYDPSVRSGSIGFFNGQMPAVRTFAAEMNLSREQEHTGDEASFLSVVVPARNEAASLPRLIDEIASALLPLCGGGRGELAGYEVIVVDDGSTDTTRSVLSELAEVYPELRTVILAAGTGQSSATVAGIRTARGDWIATLDADLQNDPADLPRLWNALPGHDAALGWRLNRQEGWSRRLASRWANRVRNLVLGQSIRDGGCSVRIFPRALALRLPVFHGFHRFLGPLLLREGCRLVQVSVRDRPRPLGRSHYSFWNRSFHVIIDLFGVAWLMSRPVQYQVARTADSGRTINRSEWATAVPAVPQQRQEE
jgi:glycosyltransferase involved in cell wall biosynthesis